jgi:AcrR family transcriptional regulator
VDKAIEDSRSAVRGRPSRRSRGNRPSDDSLLDAACAVFHESGFDAASMEAIAERADSTKPTLYAHFGSKDQLYRACLRREADRLQRWLYATYESAAGLPVTEEVRADMLALFDYAAAHAAGFGILFDDARSGPNTAVRDQLVEGICGRIAERIRAGFIRHAGVDPRLSADVLAAMVVGLAVHGAREALRLSCDITAAGELATAVAATALTRPDLRVMNAIDDQPAP